MILFRTSNSEWPVTSKIFKFINLIFLFDKDSYRLSLLRKNVLSKILLLLLLSFPLRLTYLPLYHTLERSVCLNCATGGTWKVSNCSWHSYWCRGPLFAKHDGTPANIGTVKVSGSFITDINVIQKTLHGHEVVRNASLILVVLIFVLLFRISASIRHLYSFQSKE